jgi:hypothetical protein
VAEQQVEPATQVKRIADVDQASGRSIGSWQDCCHIDRRCEALAVIAFDVVLPPAAGSPPPATILLDAKSRCGDEYGCSGAS